MKRFPKNMKSIYPGWVFDIAQSSVHGWAIRATHGDDSFASMFFASKHDALMWSYRTIREMYWNVK